jgi:biopolymer transport protein ExbD
MKALVEDDEEFSLPFTPMIDIVFLLLIFFLLATTMKQEEIDMQVNLPPGQEGPSRSLLQGLRLVINIRRDGTATLGGQAFEFPELRRRILEAGRQKEKPRVFIRGDQMAPYGKVAEVLQCCQAAGIEKVNCEFRLEHLPRE